MCRYVAQRVCCLHSHTHIHHFSCNLPYTPRWWTYFKRLETLKWKNNFQNAIKRIHNDTESTTKKHTDWLIHSIVKVLIWVMIPFPQLLVHKGKVFQSVWPSASHQPKLQDYGHSASHGVPVYLPAYGATKLYRLVNEFPRVALRSGETVNWTDLQLQVQQQNCYATGQKKRCAQTSFLMSKVDESSFSNGVSSPASTTSLQASVIATTCSSII